MKEFTFQCGCGYSSEIPSYVDAAEHYVFCWQTHWWTLTCNACRALRRITDPATNQSGQEAMLWCANHLVRCFKKSPEELLTSLSSSLERYENFLLRITCDKN